ncbi:hypothetical protein OG535_27120 [Kitasatospora sp. NBC_00085]|uniref:hypothetical protein n=1 Tax=Kitasatospora sp. NBC_00085 TaxID=2903566 RepID=UPI0032530C6B
MTDQMSVALVSLLFTGILILVPLAGAVVAALFIRRRGRNARLAMAGCLVTALGPLVLALGMALGSDTLYGKVGLAAAVGVQSAITAVFSLVGLGLVLAGALAAPVPQPAAHGGGQVFVQPVADTAYPA